MPEPVGEKGDSGDSSMFRNAYALMLSTGVSAALGLGFWLVAARYYTEEAVGQGSAAIAAQRMLASLTATTLTGAVVRYVPRAGRATGPLVVRLYVVSTVVVAVACGVFLLTLDWWGPSYAPLGTVSAGIFFTAASIGWALLTLQDAVLTGLRRAVWVPVGNAVFSLGKLVLLVVLAVGLPVLGVFVSWAAAIALSVLPVGWLVFRRLIPRQAHADRDREPPTLREIGRFLAGDSVGSVFSLLMISLLPMMVAVRFDAAHNAFFYTAYTVGGTMEFMAINMASSLTAHASHSPESLAEGVRGALRRMTLLLVPVVLVLVVFAPLILAPFGGDYARNGTTVLRLLAAAALPRVAVELYIGVLRVQGRTGMLAALQGVMCVLVLGSAVFLLGPFGIAGAGYAVLGSMTLMAVVSVPGLRATLKGRVPPEGDRAAARVKERAEDGYGTNWARESAYLRGTHDSVTPAFGIPVYVPRQRDDEPAGSLGTPGPGPRPGWESGPGWESEPGWESGPGTGSRGAGAADKRAAEAVEAGSAPKGAERSVILLWSALGLSAGLFWLPLARSGALDVERLSGTGLLTALPPVTLLAGLLLVALQGAAVGLRRFRRAFAGTVLLATFLALHTAPPLLGLRPATAGGPGAELLGAPDGPAAVVVPIALQAVCLLLVALLLRVLGTGDRVTAGVVWVLVWAGWAGQQAFAAAPLPLFLGLAGATMAACAYRGLTAGRR
ncbi:lipopolysaccharide biosynthesis protein [Streptomyces sp. NBC_00094]|uniref:lipopolysaccharide biosynthesis protein n=1 Tax=Streptomyces sp. NBC_00094 TaxID=2903620 RepID=UPI00224EEC81|nr:lipopolysaccharide biosynthesis protein [Streptomyces sp. NBC_00094]MCX5391097.1 lipopolysaccharide biosynthesis protein [Streptomyces sp. NBC_00094]